MARSRRVGLAMFVATFAVVTVLFRMWLGDGIKEVVVGLFLYACAGLFIIGVIGLMRPLLRWVVTRQWFRQWLGLAVAASLVMTCAVYPTQVAAASAVDDGVGTSSILKRAADQRLVKKWIERFFETMLKDWFGDVGMTDEELERTIDKTAEETYLGIRRHFTDETLARNVTAMCWSHYQWKVWPRSRPVTHPGWGFIPAEFNAVARGSNGHRSWEELTYLTCVRQGIVPRVMQGGWYAF